MNFLPLREHPADERRVELDGYLFAFRFRWLPRQAMWTMDLDIEDLGVSLKGYRLATGDNILFGRGLWQLGALLLVDLQGNEDPTFDGFGDRWKLVYLTKEEAG
jgi:hypothetical protein